MKYIVLNIRIFLHKSPSIFAAAILCILSSALLLNFSYGLYCNYQMTKAEMNNDLKKIGSAIDPNAAPNRQQIQNFVEALPEEISANISFYFSGSISEYENDEMITELESRFIYQQGKYSVMPEYRKNVTEKLLSGRMITDSEENCGSYVAVIYQPRAVSDKTNDESTYISLFGRSYQVIGEQNLIDGFPTIPFLAVPENFVYDRIAIMTFHNLMTRSQYEELKRTAQIYIPNAISFPDLPLPDKDNNIIYNNIILISILIAMLSVLNYAMLYRYILQKRRKSLAIFRICGCSILRTMLLYLGECVCTSLPIYGAGTVLFIVLLNHVFGNMFPYMKQSYSVNVYLMIFAIYSIVMLVIMSIMIFSYLKQSIVTGWKEDVA